MTAFRNDGTGTVFQSDKNANGTMESMVFSEFDVEMRDGIKIYTFVVRPENVEKCPVIFFRTPYQDKVEPQKHCDWCASWVHAGYAVVGQHCRGCGQSEGECFPYDFERGDGLDSLAWIRKQEFYNGEIYLNGVSYLSSVHFAYLDTLPPDVKGAVFSVQDVNRYNVLYRNGFFKCGLHGEWFVGMYKKKSGKKKNYVRDTFRMMPLSDFSQTVFGERVSSLDESFAHPQAEDPFWQTPAGGSDYLHALDNLGIPVLIITSFHDIYTEGIFRMWDQIPEKNRKNCAMVVTPYDHGADPSGNTLVEFPESKLSAVWPDYSVNWFNSIRKNETLNFVKRGEITYYSLFENQWITEPYLRNGKTMRTFHLNDHTLDSISREERELCYLYNPYAPAEFKGGCCHNFGGMQIQDAPDSRYDILSFVSAPFETPSLVQGTMELVLYVKSDCEDTCFYARFSLIRDGIAYGLRDDIVSVLGQNPDYVPGTEAMLQLHFTEHSFLVRKGDSIRLDVSSSCWPHFVPHSNRKGLFSEQTSALIAHNTIVTGKSKLILHCSNTRS